MLTITLSAAGYEAVFAPANGGACISLKKGDWEVFHHWDKEEEVEQHPTSYGLPCLFPPNRIDGGTFTYEGVTSALPIREADRNVSLHGFLHTRPWQVECYQEDEDTAEIHMVYEGGPDTDFYQEYPYEFEAELIYRLDAKGLHQEFHLTNYSENSMPYGLGWHTAFAADPDTRLRVSIGKRVPLSERALPAGDPIPLSEEEQKFRAEEGQSHVYAVMDDHFTAEPIQVDGAPFHGAVILRGEHTVYYRVDAFYKHWMIWNCFQEGSFICVEPQNWRVNAPNLAIPAEESGLDVLKPQETVTVSSDVYVK